MSLLARLDSYVNAITGLGGVRDKLMHTRIVSGVRLADVTIEALYNDDPLAQKMVDMLPREATRRGMTIKVGGLKREDSAKTTRALVAQLTKLRAMPSLRLAWIWGRLYGCGAILVGADDGQDVSEPLDETRIQTIRWLTVVRKMQLVVQTRYSDPNAEKFGEPELLLLHPMTRTGGVATTAAATILVHESRLILFPGALSARMWAPSADGWDDSVLQRANETLRQSAVGWQSVAHLMTDASQGVLKIKNLVNQLNTEGGRAAVQTRMQMMDMARSVCRSILVDADGEDFERKPTSFAGIPDLLDRFMMRDASVAEMPVTKLYGRSPAGLNATGESDTRGWYDTVQDAQTDILKPRAERLVTLCMLAKDSPTNGVVPDDWELCFPPLWQPSDKERAETRKTNADAVTALVNGNVMLDAEGALAMAEDFPQIDTEARQEILKLELEHAKELAANPPEPPDPNADPDDEPEPDEE